MKLVRKATYYTKIWKFQLHTPENYIDWPKVLVSKDGVSGLILYDGSDVKRQLVGWCLMLICSWTHRGST